MGTYQKSNTCAFYNYDCYALMIRVIEGLKE